MCEPNLSTASERQIWALSLTPAKDNWNQCNCCLTLTLAQVQSNTAEYPDNQLKYSGKRYSPGIFFLHHLLLVHVSVSGASRQGQGFFVVWGNTPCVHKSQCFLKVLFWTPLSYCTVTGKQIISQLLFSIISFIIIIFLISLLFLQLLVIFRSCWSFRMLLYYSSISSLLLFRLQIQCLQLPNSVLPLSRQLTSSNLFFKS